MQIIFWCVLANGRENSLSTDNLFDAPRRARALGAVACFCKNMSTGKTMKLSM
jgi:hypothetical protein